MKIILVEDDAELIESIQLGWPDASYRVDGYKSFAEFKPVLFSGGLGTADCVILDMQLPDASGTQIVTEIRRLSDIPIIVLSGWGETEFRADLINGGVDDYVLKPLSVKELHARVSRLIRRRTMPVALQEEAARINLVTFDRARRALRLGGGVNMDLVGRSCRILQDETASSYLLSVLPLQSRRSSMNAIGRQMEFSFVQLHLLSIDRSSRERGSQQAPAGSWPVRPARRVRRA